jgi:hypothetical protein
MTEMTTLAPVSKARRTAPPAVKPQQFVQMIINLALVIWAVRDIRRRSDEEIKGNRKIWLLAAFAPPIGPIAYFVFGRKRQPKPVEIPLEIPDAPESA